MILSIKTVPGLSEPHWDQRGQNMYICLFKIRPMQHRHQDVIDILRSVGGSTKAQAGCVACELYTCLDESDTIAYLELWETLDDINRHIRSPLYERIFTAMDLSFSKPDITYGETSPFPGLDLIEKFRSQTDHST